MGLIVIIILLALIAIGIWFIATMYSVCAKVPQDKRHFPAWFCWMMIIPLVGFIFAWLMLPFGIPKTLANWQIENAQAAKKAGSIGKIGLWLMILLTVQIILPHLFGAGTAEMINLLLGVAGLILFIIYWVNVAQFKSKFM